MTPLIEAWEAIRAFIDAGGGVLTAIFGVTLLMWTLILERLFYMRIAHRFYAKQQLAAWEKREAVKARAKQFRDALFEFNKGRKNQVPETGPRLLMLHSLAHMLITAISLECGYPATSIRERIYCADGEHERAGILLVADGEGILWVVGLARAERTRILPTTRRIVTISVAPRADHP